MSSRCFVTSDPHLGHNGITGFRTQFESSEEHDEALIENWNAVVRSQDMVWVLGDVAFNARGLTKVARLNGTKRLIMGNHDRSPLTKYSEYFSKLHGSIQKNRGVFTHIPIHPQELYRFTFNVHGHLHHETINDPRYLNVCLEQTDMKPLLMDEVLELISQRIN